MKKAPILMFIGLMMLKQGSSLAQVPVTTITYTPQDPTWIDTIQFICTTPNMVAPFSVYSEQTELVGTAIHADICYIQSPWIQVITHVDTVSVNLPAGSSGQYTFHYRFGLKDAQDSCMYEYPSPTPNDTLAIAGTITFQVNEPNGLYLTDPKTYRLFPNPASDLVTLDSPELLKGVWLTDLVGKILQPFKLQGMRWETNISELPSGIYMVVAIEENGRSAVSKLLKQ